MAWPDFKRLVKRFEAKGFNNEEAKARASRVYARQLREHDRRHPETINRLIKQGNFDRLYLHHLRKYFPVMGDAKVRSLAEIVFDAEKARKMLENPSLDLQEKPRLKKAILDLRFSLRHPELLSEAERKHAELSIQFIQKKLLNPMLTKKEKAFYGFVAGNPGALVARNKLTQNGLRFAASMAREVFYRKKNICTLAGMTLGDCIQEGSIGLIDAVNKFNPKFKATFMTYASQRVRGQILEALREKALLIQLPREILKKISSEAAFVKARADYYEKIGTAPTEKVRKKALRELAVLSTARGMLVPVSGNKPIKKEHTGRDTELFDTLQHPGSEPARQLETEELREKLSGILSRLPGKAGKVLVTRFLSQDSPLSLKEAGKKLNISEARVSQLQTDAIRFLLTEKPNLLQELGFEAPARKGAPTKQEVLQISKLLNRLYLFTRPIKFLRR